MRVSPTRLIVGTLAVGGMTLALAASPASASLTPKAVVKNAISATEAALSVRISGAITQGKQTISLNVSAGTSGTGQGTIGIGTGTATVRLVGGIVYFMRTTAFWTQQGSASAAKLFAGKWVSTAASTSTGKSLEGFLDSQSFMKQLFSSNLSKSQFVNAGTAAVAGKPVIVIDANTLETAMFSNVRIETASTVYFFK